MITYVVLAKPFDGQEEEVDSFEAPNDEFAISVHIKNHECNPLYDERRLRLMSKTKAGRLVQIRSVEPHLGVVEGR